MQLTLHASLTGAKVGRSAVSVDAMDEAGTKLLARALDLRQVYGLPEGVKLVETVPLKEEP